jgi:anti-anti-sigma regulatory factor
MDRMAATRTQRDGESVVICEGALTIQHAGEVRAALVAALNEADAVRLSVEHVTTADLAGLQLLCSAHRTALKQGKHLSYEGALSTRVARVMEEAGFARPHGCSLDQVKGCMRMAR